MRSYQTKEQRHQSDTPQKITLRQLENIKKMINLTWVIRQTNVPKGTMVGWMRRGDNMLETKNDRSPEYRKQAIKDIVLALQKLRNKIDSVIQYYQQKIRQIEE